MEAGRIHLNQVDLNMIKSSFEKDSSARVASVGDQGIGREKLHTQHSKTSMVAHTHYAPHKPSNDGQGFPIISSK